MDTQLFIGALALPMTTAGILYFLWSLLNPRRTSFLGLALWMFSMQFTLGLVLGMVGLQPPIYATGDAVMLAMGAIYVFWAGVVVTAVLWPSGLAPVAFPVGSGFHVHRGVFANLSAAAHKTSVGWIVVFYGAVKAVQIAVIVKYGLGLSGQWSNEVVASLPYWMLVIWRLADVSALAVPYLCIAHTQGKLLKSPILTAIVVLELGYSFTQGRRTFFLVGVLILYALLMRRGRLQVKHAVMLAVGALFLWSFIFPYFLAMRREWQARPEAGLVAWAQAALQSVEEGRIQHDTQQNVTERLNAMVFNFTVAEAMISGVSPLNGQFLTSSVLANIPRILRGGEQRVMNGDELINVQFGFRQDIDQFSNLPVFALADGGLPMCFLYGVIFAAGVRIIELVLCYLLRTNVLGAYAAAAIAFAFTLQMEFTLTDFVGALRSVAIVLVLASLTSGIMRARAGPPVPGAPVMITSQQARWLGAASRRRVRVAG